MPKSKYSVKNIDTGKYTLHGKPYKGPVITDYLGRIYAGDSWSTIKGVLVEINKH